MRVFLTLSLLSICFVATTIHTTNAEAATAKKGKWEMKMHMIGPDGQPMNMTMTQCMSHPMNNPAGPIPGMNKEAYQDAMDGSMEDFEYNKDGCHMKGERDGDNFHVTGNCDGEDIDMITTQKDDYYKIITKTPAGTSTIESTRIGDC